MEYNVIDELVERTYLAEERGTNKLVTIKVLAILKKDIVKNISEEIEYLKELDIPKYENYINCYQDYFEDTVTKEICLVSEYIVGENVYKMAKKMRETKTPELFYEFIYQNLCLSIEGLYYMSSKNIIHGNIKPENIIIKQEVKYQSTKKNTKLIQTFQPIFTDLALSYLRQDKEFLNVSTNRYFHAPEVIKYNKLYPKSDIWSLALSYYETLDENLWPDNINIDNQSEFINYIISGKRIFHIQTTHKHLNDLLNKMLTYNLQFRPDINSLYTDIKNRSKINTSYTLPPLI